MLICVVVRVYRPSVCLCISVVLLCVDLLLYTRRFAAAQLISTNFFHRRAALSVPARSLHAATTVVRMTKAYVDIPGSATEESDRHPESAITLAPVEPQNFFLLHWITLLFPSDTQHVQVCPFSVVYSLGVFVTSCAVHCFARTAYNFSESYILNIFPLKTMSFFIHLTLETVFTLIGGRGLAYTRKKMCSFDSHP
jgi:hypothetical protein